MKSLINKFVIISAFLMLSLPVSAEEMPGVESNAPRSSIRVIKVDASKYQTEYDTQINNDPWKGFNTAMFKFNNALDQYFLEPVARGYREGVPQWGRDRVKSFFNNLQEPANMVNAILQGDVEASFRAFWRFVINAGFGIGGLHDVAGGFGLEEKDKLFSQTLMMYGVGTGPYVVFPLLGPNTPRDLVGDGVDRLGDPTTYAGDPYVYGFTAADVISSREAILDYTDELKENSFDLYPTQKSSYLQNRKKKLLETLE